MSLSEFERKRLEKSEGIKWTARELLEAAIFDIENDKLFLNKPGKENVKAVMVMALVRGVDGDKETYRLEEYFFNTNILDQLFMLSVSKSKLDKRIELETG